MRFDVCIYGLCDGVASADHRDLGKSFPARSAVPLAFPSTCNKSIREWFWFSFTVKYIDLKVIGESV